MSCLSPWGHQYFNDDQIENYLGRIGLSVLLLGVTWWAHKIPATRKVLADIPCLLHPVRGGLPGLGFRQVPV